MTAPDFTATDTIARACAGACASAYRAPFEDLYQEAWIALLKARRTWEPAKGPFANYGSRAVRIHLLGYVARLKSPVHGHNRVLRELREARAVGVTHASQVENGSGNAESCLIALELERTVDARLEQAFASCPDGHLAKANMIGKVTAAKLAVKYGTSVFKVQRAVRRVKKLVQADPVVREGLRAS